MEIVSNFHHFSFPKITILTELTRARHSFLMFINNYAQLFGFVNFYTTDLHTSVRVC